MRCLSSQVEKMWTSHKTMSSLVFEKGCDLERWQVEQVSYKVTPKLRPSDIGIRYDWDADRQARMMRTTLELAGAW